MKEKINLVVNNIRRLLSNEEFSYRVYLILVVGTFIVVGLLGIIPSTKILISNITLASDINKNNKDLSSKLVSLKKIEGDLNIVGQNAYFLESYLPETFNIQNYLVDFVFASGEANLVVERVTPVKEDNGVVDLAVIMVGNGDVVKLVNVLESLNRVTEVQSVSVSKGKEYDTLSMLIKTFIMEKQ